MRIFVGIDEAGRGPLAGPVSVGAASVAAGFDVLAAFPGAKDSKKLSEKQREVVYAQMLQAREAGVLAFAVEFSSAEDIDTYGIVPAIRSALNRSLAQVAPEASGVEVLLDGGLHAPKEYTQKTIIGGDGSEPLISLASIAAKVERDHLMQELDAMFPGYGLAAHKGYGTKAHYAALLALGPSAVHRRSFLG